MTAELENHAMPVEDARLSAGAAPRPRSVRALLADGAIVRMRELASSDVALVAGLYEALPLEDRFYRFFSAGVAPDVAPSWRSGIRAMCPSVPSAASVSLVSRTRL